MKAILVLGATSSGTRVFTKHVVAAGAKGTHLHEQPFDEALPEPTQPIVWRRSIPHWNFQKEGYDWLPGMIKKLYAKGYNEVVCVFTIRNHFSQKRSTNKVHQPDIEKVKEGLQKAYGEYLPILHQLNIPIIPFIYEAALLYPTYVPDFMEELGLNRIESEYRDENLKHFKK